MSGVSGREEVDICTAWAKRDGCLGWCLLRSGLGMPFQSKGPFDEAPPATGWGEATACDMGRAISAT